MAKQLKDKGSTGRHSLLSVAIGSALFSFSWHWVIQTTIWIFSPNWSQPGNAMPLLLIFIIPIALLAWTGLFSSLLALILGTYKTLKVELPESNPAREKLLNRKILNFLILHFTLSLANDSIVNSDRDISLTGFPLLAITIVLLLAQLACLYFASHFIFKTQNTNLYLGWGLITFLLLIWSLLQASGLIGN